MVEGESVNGERRGRKARKEDRYEGETERGDGGRVEGR